MEDESEEELEARIRQYREQIQILEQKLKQKKRKRYTSQSADDPKPSTSLLANTSSNTFPTDLQASKNDNPKEEDSERSSETISNLHEDVQSTSGIRSPERIHSNTTESKRTKERGRIESIENVDHVQHPSESQREKRSDDNLQTFQNVTGPSLEKRDTPNVRRNKENAPGLGIEYEICLPAFFALSLNNNEKVKDFSIRSNVEKGFGNIDDVIIDIKMTDDTPQYFALQLKHKEKKDNQLIPPNFEAKGAFSLEKYCKAFKEMGGKTKQNYRFILYTNSKYDSTNRKKLNKFRIFEDEDCAGRLLFSTASESSKIYRFEVNEDTPNEKDVTKKDYEEFFQKFRVYVGQKNSEGMEEEIVDILKSKSAALSYLNLFRKWHQNRFTNKTIDRETINIHLVDIFLSDFVITDRLPINQSSNSELFQKIARKFDITVINDSTSIKIEVEPKGCETDNFDQNRLRNHLENYIRDCKIDRQRLDDDPKGAMLQCMLYLGKKYKIVDRTTQQLDARSQKKVLYYFFEELFFVDFNKSSEESIYRMFDLYQTKENSIRFVLVGPGVNPSKLSKFKVFESLNDLRNCDTWLQEVMEKCQLSLQGKDFTTVEQSMDDRGNRDFVAAKEILQMLQDDFVVRKLCVDYIPRKVFTYVVELDTILKKNFNQYRDHILIIDFDGKLQQVKHKFKEKTIDIIDSKDFIRLAKIEGKLPEEDFIISIADESSMKVFRQFFEEFDRQKLDDDPKGIMVQCMLYLDKKCKIVDGTMQQLDARSQKKVLCYLFKEFFFVDFQKSSEESIYRMFDLYQENSIRFVLASPGADRSKLPKLTVLEKVNDLRNCDNTLLQEVIKKCQLSLQGKHPITLEELIDSCGKSNFVTVKEILQMLQDDFVVGEEKEILPVNYIPRKVSTYVLKLDTILKKDFVKTNILTIDFDGKLEQVRHKFEERTIKIIEGQNFNFDKLRSTKIPDMIISAADELSIQRFRLDLQKYDIDKFDSLIHLKMIDLETFLPVIYKVEDRKIFSETFIQEARIHDFLTNKINILCAEPGMGKSTMFKFLKNQLSNFWTVLIDLKTHNKFLKAKRPMQEVLNEFLKRHPDSFLSKIKTCLLMQNKLIFFFDGLDELESQCIENVLDYCEKISNSGLRVWVSSRPNLETRLVSRFCQYCVHIKEITKEEQIEYIQNRLLVQYKDEEICQLAEEIFRSNYIDHHRRLLGVPLQLYMMTQIFLDNEGQYNPMTKDVFVLTKMYKIFFNGRYKHTSEKQNSENPHLMIGEPEDHLEKYEILALQVLLDDDVLLQLDLDTRRSTRFLEEIRTKKDPLGVVVKVNRDNKAIFEHYTYAEYFACFYLVHNFAKAKILRQHLSCNRYRSLLLMLNVMLAEENPLHLAIIYRDLELIDAHRDDLNIYDKGGRNPLHVAVAHGAKYPGCFTREDTECSFTTLRYLEFAELIITDMRIIKYVIKFDPFTHDKIFDWNCVDYAFGRDCLVAAELLLTKYPKFEISNLERYKNDPIFASFCTLAGTINLLSRTLGESLIPTMNHWLQESLLHHTITFCFFNKFEMLRFLVEKGVNVDTKYGKKTALQLAVQTKNIEAVKYLLDRGSSTNVTTTDGDTLLHCAFQNYPFTRLDALGEKIDALSYEQIGVTSSPKCQTVDLVTELTTKDVSINSRNKKGETALHLAVATGDQPVVQLLHQKGADINAVTKNNSNVLHYAANTFNTDLTTFLIDNIGLSINAKDDNGATPLLTAVKTGNHTIVGLLLGKGADVNICDNNGLSPLHWSSNTGHLYVAETIINKGIDNIDVPSLEGLTPLHIAAHKDFGVTELLLDKGANVNVLTGEGVHCLQLAVYSGNVKTVKLFLDRLDLSRVVWTPEKYSLSDAVQDGVLQHDLLLKLTESMKNMWYTFML